MTPEELYSKLYRIAGHILRENDPCQIQTEDGKTTCLSARRGGWGKESDALCCSQLRYPNKQEGAQRAPCAHWQAGKGCTTEALGCKLFLCPVAGDSNPDTRAALQMLVHAAYAVPVPVPCYLSKEEAFAESARYASARLPR